MALDAAGAGHVAHRAAADRAGRDLLTVDRRDIGRGGEENAVARQYFPAVGEVDGGIRQALLGDVLPHVEFGPVGQGEDAEVFSRVLAAVEEAPEFRPLEFGIPMTVADPKGSVR